MTLDSLEKLRNELSLMTTQELRDHVITLEHLLESREVVIKTIPPCPIHGEGCLPHCLEWIAEKKNENSNEAHSS